MQVEAHYTQMGQQTRTHRSALWKYWQKGQGVPPRSIECSDLWCPGWDSKDLR